MYLKALQHAVPAGRYEQAEIWRILKKTGALGHLRGRSVNLLEKVLHGESGIVSRHFATEDVEGLFRLSAEELNRYFEVEAPALACEAMVKALAEAGMDASGVDALFLSTCTGYLCPGPTSHVAERLGLREDCVLQDVVGLGCGAAIPTLRAASDFLHSRPEAVVAVVAVEICSSAFYLDDDPGVLISLCLFGDAASASLWTGKAPGHGPGLRAHGFRSLHRPEAREDIRFTNVGGFLRNQLARSVPELAAESVARMVGNGNGGFHGDLLAHPGGRDVLSALSRLMPQYSYADSSRVLSEYGNCSSPSVMIALEHSLARGEVDGGRMLAAFGAGFTCHTCHLDAV